MRDNKLDVGNSSAIIFADLPPYIPLHFMIYILVHEVFLVMNLHVGTPLLFVVVGLAARVDYYGVKDDDGELSL